MPRGFVEHSRQCEAEDVAVEADGARKVGAGEVGFEEAADGIMVVAERFSK